MKQKQVKPSPKVVKKAKALKKPTPLVKIQKKVEESEDEDDEVIQEKVKAKKPAVKKASKVPKFIVEEPSDDGDEEEEVDDIDEDAVEHEEDEGVSDADGAEEDEENENDEEVEAANGDEETESEEDDGDDDDHDDDDDGDDDGEAPKEEATEREKQTLPSKVKIGPIIPTVPAAKIIYIKNLPKKCNQVDIVEVFAKYGAIDQIHIITNPNATSAYVAYKTEKAATAALAANEKAKINNSVLSVSLKREKKKPENNKPDRTAYIRFTKKGASEGDIRQHFKSCGEIENINLIEKFNQAFAYITFKEQSAMPAALKLNNSLLNGFNIRVSESKGKNDRAFNERLTITLKNKQNLESLDAKKLEDIFSKCGEISNMNVMCAKNILAFISFKTEEAVQKALKLNGKNLQGVDLEIEAYCSVKKWTTIHVSNLPKDCTNEDLTNCFSKAGEIDNITFKEGGSFAIIRFADSDGYCKSFLYNESVIKGQTIFVEPYSLRKMTMIKSLKFKKTGFKRHAQNGHSAFKPKRAKFN